VEGEALCSTGYSPLLSFTVLDMDSVTLDPKSQTLDPKPLTLNPKP